MEALILIVFVFIVFQLAPYFLLDKQNFICKTHTWQYNEQNRLQCIICKKFPGEET